MLVAEVDAVENCNCRREEGTGKDALLDFFALRDLAASVVLLVPVPVVLLLANGSGTKTFRFVCRPSSCGSLLFIDDNGIKLKCLLFWCEAKREDAPANEEEEEEDGTAIRDRCFVVLVDR